MSLSFSFFALFKGVRTPEIVRRSARAASYLAAVAFAASPWVATAPVAADSVVAPGIVRFDEDPAIRLATFVDHISKIRSLALQRGTITYSEVLCAAYGDERDLDEILAAKAQWRQAQDSDVFTFLTDYDTLSSEASVSEVEPTRNRQLGSTLIGRYEPRSHAIKIAHTAGDFAIIHEAGHALQHAALRDRSIRRSSSVSFTRFERNLSSYQDREGVDRFAARRLRYLASQDELEVRLQDLNRFHAIVMGRGPIMTPHDTLRALAAIGMKLDPQNAATALDGSHWSASADELAALMDEAAALSLPAGHAPHFDDSYELVMMRGLTRKVDEQLWPNLLRKILFEAPGHL